MSDNQKNSLSFLVRFWKEGEQDQWCGELEHIQSGTKQTFVGLNSLQDLFLVTFEREAQENHKPR